MHHEIHWTNQLNFKGQPQVARLPNLLAKAACITLQASTEASLEWKEEIKSAEKYLADGYNLLWDMQFGLFDKLKAPLSSSMQLQALQLALDQFQTTIWEKFEHCSAGIILFRGPLNLASQFPWDKIQESNFNEWLQNSGYAQQSTSQLTKKEKKRLANYFCLAVATEYLQLLSAHLPPAAKAYVLLEVEAETSLLDEALMLNQERFGWLQPIGIAAKHACTSAKAKVGICLPPLETSLAACPLSFENLFASLKRQHVDYRLIPEEQITSLWGGLDVLIIQADLLASQTKRKLQGFVAAGGHIVTCGRELLGLSAEELFSSWIEKLAAQKCT